MWGWAILLLVAALVAGAFGFRGTADVPRKGARILFFVFLALFVLAVVF